MKCPNCLDPIEGHPENSCILNTLIQVVRERGNTTEERLKEIHAKCIVDLLWIDIGPILDDLEDGRYSGAEEQE